MIEVAVTVNLECAHRSRDGVLHGHSYVVEVWFLAGEDMSMLAAEVHEVAEQVDHSLLEESVGAASMEAIAEWFLREAEAVRVVVRRPTLGYVVEARI